ncbi:MAG: type II toxin-antitoxin system PemK/MazF family toxin [Clostridia bacterium]|nr:type II toxin-antitoxin system PemK/MazF family toxin [Clostridia bacterium]MDD3093286.1 type II toxin-antitoxin system PemK/MazF family toxin [Clostridia bacterium]MDD3971823.1 type II toxin-antitoxin system PemK/MazF family toxin [Clostridia bacterium]
MKFNINRDLTLCSKCEHSHFEQIRTIDKIRLTDYLGKFDEEMLLKIDRAIVVSFGIKYLEGLQNG